MVPGKGHHGENRDVDGHQLGQLQAHQEVHVSRSHDDRWFPGLRLDADADHRGSEFLRAEWYGVATGSGEGLFIKGLLYGMGVDL